MFISAKLRKMIAKCGMNFLADYGNKNMLYLNKDYCEQYTCDVVDSTAKIYELNGIIEGIICDNEINEKEVYRLREWMQENSAFIRGHMPSKAICEKIDEILTM